jgi:hypothetical protein
MFLTTICTFKALIILPAPPERTVAHEQHMGGGWPSLFSFLLYPHPYRGCPILCGERGFDFLRSEQRVGLDDVEPLHAWFPVFAVPVHTVCSRKLVQATTEPKAVARLGHIDDSNRSRWQLRHPPGELICLYEMPKRAGVLAPHMRWCNHLSVACLLTFRIIET